MLDGDAAVEVGPVLLDGALPLELAHLVQEAVASPCQSKVEIEVGLAALQVWLLDLGHHLLEGRVWPEVGKGELYAAVREVVTGADILHRQGDVELGQAQGLDVVDQRLLELLLRGDQALQIIICLACDRQRSQ